MAALGHLISKKGVNYQQQIDDHISSESTNYDGNNSTDNTSRLNNGISSISKKRVNDHQSYSDHISSELNNKYIDNSIVNKSRLNDGISTISIERAKYHCDICDYNTSKMCEYNKHITTPSHLELISRMNTKPVKKNIYQCVECEYVTNKKFGYDRHIKTQSHKDCVERKGNKQRTFYCEICDYTTNKKYNYDSHLLSRQHADHTEITTDETPQYKCDHCNYHSLIKSNYVKHLTSKKHKTAVEEQTTTAVIKDEVLPAIQEEPPVDVAFVLKLLMQNQEIQKQMIEQINQLQNKNNQIENAVVKQTEILDVISKKEFGSNNTINNTNTTNTNCTTNNNTANINIFLNEQCKDAMNMTDFLKTIKYTAESLKHMERNGFANTITKLFTDKLHELSLYERPIHCTDIKREVMYIKDNDEWQKNSDEQTMRDKMVNKYIPIMEKDNLKAFCQYYRDHPEYNEIGHPEYESYFTLARQVNNGRDKESNDVKIIKNICKETHLSRTMIK